MTPPHFFSTQHLENLWYMLIVNCCKPTISLSKLHWLPITRISFLILMLEFSLTLTPWFFKTLPSFGTGAFNHYPFFPNDFFFFDFSSQISSLHAVHCAGNCPCRSSLQQGIGNNSFFHLLSGTDGSDWNNQLLEKQHPLLWPARVRTQCRGGLDELDQVDT